MFRRSSSALFVMCWCSCSGAGPALAQSADTVSGTVVDVSGLAVAGAEVIARTADGRTDDPRRGRRRHVLDRQRRGQPARHRARLRADRGRVASSPASRWCCVPPPSPIRWWSPPRAAPSACRAPRARPSSPPRSSTNSAAGALDDVLRSTPGFNLFRRSSSRVANPTTQGVTLRGVSGSGASRTLVLSDGVPLNDPFGSWVYWNRVPQAAVDRVEVVRGATGDLYGADALGGVIQVLTFAPDRTRARAAIEGGSFDTFRGSLFGGVREATAGPRRAPTRAPTTDGAYTVAPEARGPIDTTRRQRLPDRLRHRRPAGRHAGTPG